MLPVLVTVNCCTALQLVPPAFGATVPKLRLVGVNVIPIVPPVTVSGSWCGEPDALSLSVRFAVRAPAAEGVAVMLYEQLVNAANGLAHVVLVIVKSDRLVPVIVAGVKVRLAPPELLSVAFNA